MLDLQRIEKEDYPSIKSVVDHVNRDYQNKDGNYYYFLYKGDYRVLYKCDNVYVVYTYDNEKNMIDYIVFVRDKDEDQLFVNFGDYLLHIARDSEAFEDKNGIIHYLNIIKTDDECSGYAYYSQLDNQKDISLVQFYYHHFIVDKDRKQRIYQMRLNDPAKVIIRKKASKKMNKAYLPTNSTIYSKLSYNDVRGGSLYNYFYDDKEDRYFRIIGMLPSGKLLPLLKKAYKEKEMEEMIKSYGFRVDVPEILVEYYNGEVMDTSYFWDLVDEEMSLDKGISLGKKSD